ncbi:probable GPI-anchored adhesin-like protein PGA55 [Homarus americanus]|uniref:probable GPI-anchored adhesin-like protein PGA55 n=1 Tax=Homarus americanus TaxID=6706 RepID=UPI001C491FD4|nr:probable GPI-anchored adhesin-like protein PGA55 [Homarus americanus]
MASDSVEEFMNSALVTWVRTFESDGGGGLTYAALADGVFLYDVMLHIDPRDGGGRHVNRHPTDAASRLANLAALLNHIKTFYQVTSNTSKVTSNTSQVTSNTSQVTSNTSKVTSNTSKVTSNTSKVTSNTSQVTSNTSQVTSNTSQVTSNTSQVTSN